MNEKIVNQIHSLLKVLSEEDLNAFERKSRNALYLKLFHVIRNNREMTIQNLNEEIKKLQGNANDAKENLLKKLLEFIYENEIEKGSHNLQLKRSIEMVDILLEKNVYDLAIDLMKKNYKALKKIKPGENGYLFIQHINQVLKFRFERPDSESLKLPYEFEQEEISWLNQFSKEASKYFHKPSEKIEDFQSNPLFYSYLHYLSLKSDWHSINRESVKLDRLFSPKEKFDSAIKLREKFRLLEIALNLNDNELIQSSLNEIEDYSVHNLTNYRLHLYLMVQISELRIRQHLNSFPSTPEKLRKDLHLFSESEIENTGLRIEMNKGVILLLTKEYKKAYNHFSKIGKKDLEPELRFFIYLFELIAYRFLGVNDYKRNNFEKDLESIKSIDYKKTKFLNAFVLALEDDTIITKPENIISLGEGESISLFEQVLVQVVRNLKNWSEK